MSDNPTDHLTAEQLEIINDKIVDICADLELTPIQCIHGMSATLAACAKTLVEFGGHEHYMINVPTLGTIEINTHEPH